MKKNLFKCRIGIACFGIGVFIAVATVLMYYWTTVIPKVWYFTLEDGPQVAKKMHQCVNDSKIERFSGYSCQSQQCRDLEPLFCQRKSDNIIVYSNEEKWRIDAAKQCLQVRTETRLNVPMSACVGPNADFNLFEFSDSNFANVFWFIILCICVIGVILACTIIMFIIAFHNNILPWKPAGS